MTDSVIHQTVTAAHKPFGPVAAVFVSTAIGAVVLGVLTTLAEASARVASALTFSTRVGPLSGKTIIAVAAWLVSWAILHPALARKRPSPTAVFAWTAVLFGVAVILTFPPFFELFAPGK
ncbi:MAG: hypothetical protein C4344_05880 [Acidimicrobiia bacterium]